MVARFSGRLAPRPTLIDRDVPLRMRSDAFEVLAADPATRVVLVSEGRALSHDRALTLLPTSALPDRFIEDAAVRIYLGRSLAMDVPEPVGTPLVAVALDRGAATALQEGMGNARLKWLALRDLSGVTARDAELAAYAIALTNWHASHGFSPRTGGATETTQSGWVRRASDPDHEIYPRIDPSIIVAVLDDDDRILLGSNTMWDANRYSLLAGFVEPGESLEGAVEREVFEESGIYVTDAHYVGSQPWPYPASLMLGFTARVDPDRTSTLTPDGDEIRDVRWFTREELADPAREFILPGHASIARQIIELWFGGPITDPDESRW